MIKIVKHFGIPELILFWFF